jgi:hypothetical protein
VLRATGNAAIVNVSSISAKNGMGSSIAYVRTTRTYIACIHCGEPAIPGDNVCATCTIK